jgi:hypothetical protein
MCHGTETQPGLYFVPAMLMVNAESAQAAGEKAQQEARDRDIHVYDDRAVLVETSDGKPVCWPEPCGAVHVGKAVTVFDGYQFRKEARV